MPIEHFQITDPHIHEPKDISTATADTVYVASGSGTGTWKAIDSSNMDISEVALAVEAELSGTVIRGTSYFVTRINDISTAQNALIAVRDDCTIKGATLVLGGTITGNNAAISFKNSSGAKMGTDVTVVHAGSAKGNIYTFTASSNNVLVGPTFIEIDTDGLSTGSAPIYITISFEHEVN